MTRPAWRGAPGETAKRNGQLPESLPEPANAALIAGRYGCKPGAITLARHGEPALSRKVRLSAAEYDAWWARYELGGLKAGQTPPESLLALARDAEVIVSSTRPRSVETAQAVSGARGFTPESVMIEAPLPPPRWPGFLKLKPRTWGVIARTAWWFFDAHRGRESREEAKLRAAAAADRLEQLARDGGDVLVLAHGFFNAMVGVELKRRGWRLVRNEGYRYWSARRYCRG
jgi:broad specificity phosphatase PhoE